MEQLETGNDDSKKGAPSYILFWLSVVLVLVTIVSLTVFGLWRERPEPIPVERGDLSGMIADIVDAMPVRASEGYQKPSLEEEAQFGALASALRTGDLEKARRLAEALDYTLVRYDDASTGRSLLVAREEGDPTREPERGWGTIVVKPEGEDVLIEVPHPVFDMKTPLVGVEMFRETGASVLLVAGAHRYSWDDKRSDVAHAPKTAFDAAHEALLPARFVVQPHGFHSDEEDRYPDVVLSGGVAPAPPRVQAIRRALQDEGADVGLFDGGSRFKNLAGTTNIQGASTRDSGGEFLHVELARKLREDEAERSEFARALASALARTSESAEE